MANEEKAKVAKPKHPQPPERDPPLVDPFVPQTFDPESSDGLRLSMSWWLVGTGRLWRRLLDERLKTAGQTQPRWRVLAWARIRPGIKQTELAERMGISGPTLVRILDNLEQQRLIERRDSMEDRRIKEVHLTERARPLVGEISVEVKNIRDALLADISDDDLRTCLRVLGHIRTKAADLGDWPPSRIDQSLSGDA